MNEQSIMDYITEIEMIYSMQDETRNNESENDNESDNYNDNDNESENDNDNGNIDQIRDIENNPISEENNTFYDLIRMYSEQNQRQYRNFFSIDSDIIQVTRNAMMIQIQDTLENEMLNQTIQASLEQDQPIEKKVLSDKGKTSIKSFSFRYNKDYNDKITYCQCPISLEPFRENDKISKLPCGHEFIHSNIMKWLESESVNCPVCRYELDYKIVLVRPNQ